MARFVTIALVLLAAPSLAHADQCAYVAAKVAAKAASLIKTGDHLLHHCAPCGESARPHVVEALGTTVRPAGVEALQEVQVNGKGIDLAYVYVKSKDSWESLAKLAGCPTTGVPATLAKLPPGTLEHAEAEALRAWTTAWFRQGDELLELLVEPVDRDLPTAMRVALQKTGAASSGEVYAATFAATAKPGELILKDKDGCQLTLSRGKGQAGNLALGKACAKPPKELGGAWTLHADAEAP